MHHRTVTRRSILRGGIALAGVAAAATGLAACGEDAGSQGAATPSGTATPDAAAFPRTVDHEQGSTEIVAAPQRIVCGTDGSELCSLLTLGLVPVGFGQRSDPPPRWLDGMLDGIDSYDLSSSETSYEALAAWTPDLILVQNGFATPETMPRFTDVAPTVATSFIDWRDNLRQVAQAVGLEDRAAEIEADRDAAVSAVAEGLARDLGPAVEGFRMRAVTAFSDGSVYELNADSPLGKTCEALGLAALPASTAEGEAVNLLSAEQIGSVEADLLLLLTFDRYESGNAGLRENPLFQRLPAVRDGALVEVGPDDADQIYFDAVLTVEPNARLVDSYVRDALA